MKEREPTPSATDECNKSTLPALGNDGRTMCMLIQDVKAEKSNEEKLVKEGEMLWRGVKTSWKCSNAPVLDTGAERASTPCGIDEWKESTLSALGNDGRTMRMLIQNVKAEESRNLMVKAEKQWLLHENAADVLDTGALGLMFCFSGIFDCFEKACISCNVTSSQRELKPQQ
uniref:Uncharacterized protein n=1 Tax=Acrobeloides nanus TaxID=290746 RepID=A0A914C266_9BILA